MNKRIVSKIVTLLVCGVPGCGAKFNPARDGGTSGKKTGKCLCNTHYQRTLRNPKITAEELAAPVMVKGEAREQMTFRPTKATAKRLRTMLKAQKRGTGGPLAGRNDLSMSELIELAVHKGLESFEPFAPYVPGE